MIVDDYERKWTREQRIALALVLLGLAILAVAATMALQGAA
jgi:hypothetical protein